MGCLFTKHTARVVAASMSDPDEYYLQFNLMAFRRPFNAIGIRDIDIMQLHCTFWQLYMIRIPICKALTSRKTHTRHRNWRMNTIQLWGYLCSAITRINSKECISLLMQTRIEEKEREGETAWKETSFIYFLYFLWHPDIFREIDEDDSKTLSIKEFFDYFHFQCVFI